MFKNIGSFNLVYLFFNYIVGKNRNYNVYEKICLKFFKYRINIFNEKYEEFYRREYLVML